MIKIYPENPNEKTLSRVVKILENDGVIVYPTDTVYAVGCSLKSSKAIERIQKIRGKSGDDLSIVCPDLSHIADYAKVDTPTFKSLKRHLPGAFTFILAASNKVPDKFLENKKTIGVRIPDNNIAISIVQQLGFPIVTTSVKAKGDVAEYMTDPELIEENYGSLVDLVIDGGYGSHEASTIIDYTDSEPVVVRQGKGIFEI